PPPAAQHVTGPHTGHIHRLGIEHTSSVTGTTDKPRPTPDPGFVSAETCVLGLLQAADVCARIG
ncbi:MAG: hypothetical protein WBA72_02765, partial [Ornithinimicrobium sp.]